MEDCYAARAAVRQVLLGGACRCFAVIAALAKGRVDAMGRLEPIFGNWPSGVGKWPLSFRLLCSGCRLGWRNPEGQLSATKRTLDLWCVAEIKRVAISILITSTLT